MSKDIWTDPDVEFWMLHWKLKFFWAWLAGKFEFLFCRLHFFLGFWNLKVQNLKILKFYSNFGRITSQLHLRHSKLPKIKSGNYPNDSFPTKSLKGTKNIINVIKKYRKNPIIKKVLIDNLIFFLAEFFNFPSKFDFNFWRLYSLDFFPFYD